MLLLINQLSGIIPDCNTNLKVIYISIVSTCIIYKCPVMMLLLLPAATIDHQLVSCQFKTVTGFIYINKLNIDPKNVLLVNTNATTTKQ